MASQIKLDAHGRLVPASSPGKPTTDECEQLVADINYSAIEDLLSSLLSTRLASGRSLTEVAATLDAPEEMVNDIETGNYELSLEELREYLYAIDAVASFKIVPNAREAIYSALVKASSISKAKDMWVEHEPEITSRTTFRGSIAGFLKSEPRAAV